MGKAIFGLKWVAIGLTLICSYANASLEYKYSKSSQTTKVGTESSFDLHIFKFEKIDNSKQVYIPLLVFAQEASIKYPWFMAVSISDPQSSEHFCLFNPSLDGDVTPAQIGQRYKHIADLGELPRDLFELAKPSKSDQNGGVPSTTIPSTTIKVGPYDNRKTMSESLLNAKCEVKPWSDIDSLLKPRTSSTDHLTKAHVTEVSIDPNFVGPPRKLEIERTDESLLAAIDEMSNQILQQGKTLTNTVNKLYSVQEEANRVREDLLEKVKQINGDLRNYWLWLTVIGLTLLLLGLGILNLRASKKRRNDEDKVFDKISEKLKSLTSVNDKLNKSMKEFAKNQSAGGRSETDLPRSSLQGHSEQREKPGSKIAPHQSADSNPGTAMPKPDGLVVFHNSHENDWLADRENQSAVKKFADLLHVQVNNLGEPISDSDRMVSEFSLLKTLVDTGHFGLKVAYDLAIRLDKQTERFKQEMEAQKKKIIDFEASTGNLDKVIHHIGSLVIDEFKNSGYLLSDNEKQNGISYPQVAKDYINTVRSRPEFEDYGRALTGLRHYLDKSEIAALPCYKLVGLDELCRQLREKESLRALYASDDPREALIGQWRYAIKLLYRAILLLDTYWPDSQIELRAKLEQTRATAAFLLCTVGIVPHNLKLLKSVSPNDPRIDEAKHEPVPEILERDPGFRDKVKPLSDMGAVFCDVKEWGFDSVTTNGEQLVEVKSLMITKEKRSRWE